MDIRTFRIGDISEMRVLWNEVVLAGNAFPQTDPLRDDAEALSFFRRQTRTAVAVVPSEAGDQDRVVGLYILHPNNIGRCAHIANASYAVLSGERGRGIGRALVEDSIAHLADCGFTGLQFNAVVASNAGALALYEKLGFTRIGSIPGGFQNKDGQLEDMFIFYHAASSPQATPAFVQDVATPTFAPDAAPVLICNNLTKRYGAVTALDAVSLSLAPGRIVGLLGPNGSGKTTLIKLAAGLLQPSSGQMLIQGKQPSPATKALVSYLPERSYFPPSMRVQQTLAFFADFYADFDVELAHTMLKDLGIPANTPMAALSKGTKEKVQLILVMARHAALYLLDEPIGGVDPATRDYILKTIIGGYRRNSTLLISTHLVADVEPVLDEVIFLGQGHIFAQGPVEAFKAQTGTSLDEYFRRTFAC